jgi:hypothetical protein
MDSISAYKKALSLLPPELTAMEKTLKKQYKLGIDASQEAHNRVLRELDESYTCSAPAKGLQPNSELCPWNRAVKLLSEAVPPLSYDRNSSVCNII